MADPGGPVPNRDDGLGPDAGPLIVTAEFDGASRRLFEDLRTRHFPPSLNQVPAHLTLFHHLPGLELPRIDAHLRHACGSSSPMWFGSSGYRLLGRGVAIEVECRRLSELRRSLAEQWRSWLTPQDRQGFRPHVTVQNKVSPTAARALLRELSATLEPASGSVLGLALWRYRGGPWEAEQRYPFGAEPAVLTQPLSAGSVQRR